MTRWPATLAAALLLVVLLASIRYHVTVRHPNTWRLEISGGAARVNWDTGTPTAAAGPTQYDAGTHSAPMEWWPRLYRRVGWPGFILPLWFPGALFAVPAGWLWIRNHRPPAGCCPRCAYSLRGLPAGAACPECGADARSRPSPTKRGREPQRAGPDIHSPP